MHFDFPLRLMILQTIGIFNIYYTMTAPLASEVVSKPVVPGKRSYTKVKDSQRNELIALLDQNMSIKDASDQMGINYENAKAIFRVYRLE